MRKTILALCAACALALSLALAGCGGDNAAKAKEAFVGTWNIVSIEDDGEEMGAEYLSAMEQMGITFTLELKEDETGVFTLAGQTMDATWEASSPTEGTITIASGSAPMTIANGQLSLEDNGSKMVFEKEKA